MRVPQWDTITTRKQPTRENRIHNLSDILSVLKNRFDIPAYGVSFHTSVFVFLELAIRSLIATSFLVDVCY